MKRSVFFFGVLSLILPGCGFPKLEKEAPGVNEVPVNSRFTIVLPEEHHSGYIWQLSQGYDEAVIGRINEVWHGNEKGIYYNLNALSAGQTTLTFVSRKYRDTAATKQFIIKVNAK